jgi:hypothetical protein
MEGVYPEMPTGIEDRAADVWEPLLAVADAAGGKWPDRARVAAVALVADSKRSTPSLGIRLLADIRKAFNGQESMSTENILKSLCELEEAPWADMRGKALDARKLARILKPYGVESRTVRIGGRTPKGYTKEDLWDPWIRYLGEPPQESATSATNATGVSGKWTDQEIEETRQEREAI